MKTWTGIAGMMLAFTVVQGQPTDTLRGVEVGLYLSGYSYAGEYTDPGAYNRRVYPGGAFYIQQVGTRRLRMQACGVFGQFADQYDNLEPPPQPGVSIPTFIITRIVAGDLRLQYRPLPGLRVQPWISAGAGLIYFSPRDKNGRKLADNTNTRPDGTSYNTVIPQIPLSGGVYARINRHLNLGLGYTFRFIPSDYLDNSGAGLAGFDQLHALQAGLDIWIMPPPPPTPVR
ncbi:MAG: hypothetical protein SF053_16220 [Bacteroidia bacterium]|nr:hypothetical protein [Bacteroidia bacterium]